METHSYFRLLLKLWTVLLLFEVAGSLAESYKQYYIGCYIDGNPSRRLFGNHQVNIENMSPKACIESCKSKNYAYAGIQYGVECFCGNERPLFTARTDETECSTDCPGNKEEKCGAGWRTSAYKTGLTGTPPREKLNYIGCYSDFGSEDRRLFDKFQSDFTEGQTPHYCVGLCYALGYGYAALQYNFECFCGNNHPPSERLTNDGECGLECTGDKNEKCGGHWKLSVYSTSIPDIPALGRYIGCYIDNGDKRVFNGIKKDFTSRNNPQLCVNFCLRNNYQYAGLQYGRECYCGNDELTAGLVPDHQCEMECPGDDTRACGDHWRLAVYQLTIQFKSPQYLGCFKDESSEIRLFKGYQQNFYNSLTVQSCIDICRSKGFQYSGLQYKYQCFCEDRKPPNASLVDDNNCLYPCSGDSSQICGGDWRYSVYWNGLKNPLRNADNYIGCYRERNAPLQLLPLETVSFERSLTPQLCIDHCFRKGYPYSGTQISYVNFETQQKSQCHCGDFKPSTEHKTDESQCSASCPGDQNNKCGGDWRISVYRTGVFRYNQTYADSGYKGCYNYDRRMLSQYKVDLVNNNSPVRCLGVCKGIGYVYAGLKNGKECYCGVQLPPSASLARGSECRTPCSGDSAAICGGDTTWSVYQIPETLDFGSKVTDDLQITPIDGETDHVGNENSLPIISMTSLYSLEDIMKNISSSVIEDTKNLSLSELQRFTLLETLSVLRLMKLELYSNIRNRKSYDSPNKRRQNKTATDIDKRFGGNNGEDPQTCKRSKTEKDGKERLCSGDIIFEDDFNDLSIDRWQHSVRMPGNNFAYFSSDKTNSFVKNGILHIHPNILPDETVTSGKLDLEGCTVLDQLECKREALYWNILPPIASAKISTRNYFSFKYGIIEIRAKLPVGDWLIPEILLEPKTAAYGLGLRSGRIKIAGANGNEDLITSDGKDISVKYLDYGVTIGQDDNIPIGRYVTELKAGGWNLAYHNYTLIWTPDDISLMIDNELLTSIKPENTENLCALLGQREKCNIWSKGTKMAPFDKQFYLTLGLSAGGRHHFPDNCKTRGHNKPWKNEESKALLNFYEDKNKWHNTWKGDAMDLKIDYVRVRAL